MTRYIDLHTHTYYSDGVLSPAELVKKAKETGLSAIAISDHDNIDGLVEGLATGEKIGMEVIPAVEITSYPDPLTEFHLLGYFIDWQNKEFQATLTNFQKQREERSKKIIKNLNDLGYLIDFGDLRSFARGTIVQPHIAWMVIADVENKEKLKSDFGHLPSTGEFIVKYLKPGAPAYEPRETLEPKAAIELIHKVGGVVVLAHPCWSLTKKTASELEFDDIKLRQLIANGIDGLEVYAHRDSEEDTKLCVEHYEKLAKDEGLLVSGGSDYHGFGSAGKELGFTDFYLKVPYEVLDQLKLKINK